MGRSRNRGWKAQEVRGFFSQKSEKEVVLQAEYIKDFCDWNLDDFVGFVKAQASQGVVCCFFVITKRNYEAIQKLNAEAILRGIHMPISVRIVGVNT